jgi:predicted ester cyclase
VRSYLGALDAANAHEVATVIRRFTNPGYRWRGVHPFNELYQAEEVAEACWQPFKHAFSSVQRRESVFMAGINAEARVGGEWVCSMGHFMGLLDEDWLGIPATGKIVFLPYAEFHRVASGRIAETAFFCDILSVMRQAGCSPLPASTGAAIVAPPPRTQDGLLLGPQDPAEGATTLALIQRMIDDLIASGLHSPPSELRTTWREDMCWFGPEGIGATCSIDRYEQQHQGPFAAGLADIRSEGQECCLAEGHYGGLFGWPALEMTCSGGFMGQVSSGRRTQMRLVDIYRREGDKLAENWIFIDLLHFLSLQGLDVLGRLHSNRHRPGAVERS